MNIHHKGNEKSLLERTQQAIQVCLRLAYVVYIYQHLNASTFDQLQLKSLHYHDFFFFFLPQYFGLILQNINVSIQKSPWLVLPYDKQNGTGSPLKATRGHIKRHICPLCFLYKFPFFQMQCLCLVHESYLNFSFLSLQFINHHIYQGHLIVSLSFQEDIQKYKLNSVTFIKN